MRALVGREVFLWREAILEVGHDRINIRAKHLSDGIKVGGKPKLCWAATINRLDEIDARIRAESLSKPFMRDGRAAPIFDQLHRREVHLMQIACKH